MDYEKVLGERLIPTYEELKSGLLRLIDEGKISREDAARVLPELRESEDERIRKVIYKLMLGMREEIFTSQDEIVTKEKALAYLEKKPGIKIWPHPIKDAYLEQKEPKPAWSEEDKSILDALIYDIERLPMQGVLTHRPCDSYIKFLKALRPGWKPTEEQMKALKIAVNDTCRNDLASLYRDLLKLKQP